MLDEEHAVSGRVLPDDDVSLLEDLELQLGENGVQEVDVSVLQHERVFIKAAHITVRISWITQNNKKSQLALQRHNDFPSLFKGPLQSKFSFSVFCIILYNS